MGYLLQNHAGLCMQACQKELSQQKAAYERAVAEILERQQAQKAKATKETAAEALRSHPLAETPPREPHTRAHASLLGDESLLRIPVLRSRYAHALTTSVSTALNAARLERSHA